VLYEHKIAETFAREITVTLPLLKLSLPKVAGGHSPEAREYIREEVRNANPDNRRQLTIWKVFDYP
jgi:hypothetical protein